MDKWNKERLEKMKKDPIVLGFVKHVVWDRWLSEHYVGGSEYHEFDMVCVTLKVVADALLISEDDLQDKLGDKLLDDVLKGNTVILVLHYVEINHKIVAYLKPVDWRNALVD